MNKVKDELDKNLLNRIELNPGTHVREIIRPFLYQKSESALRQRIEALAREGLIKLEHGKKEVRCFPL